MYAFETVDKLSPAGPLFSGKGFDGAVAADWFRARIVEYASANNYAQAIDEWELQLVYYPFKMSKTFYGAPAAALARPLGRRSDAPAPRPPARATALGGSHSARRAASPA